MAVAYICSSQTGLISIQISRDGTWTARVGTVTAGRFKTPGEALQALLHDETLCQFWGIETSTLDLPRTLSAWKTVQT